MIDIETCYETLNYKEAVPVRGTFFSKNRFLKVTVLEADYFISVLPGFHNATLEEIQFKLSNFFKDYTLNFNNIDFSKKFFNTVILDNFLNSFSGEVLFNVETILISLIKKKHPEHFNNNLIMLNELYRPSFSAANYKDSKCLKIKITPASIKKTIDLIKELHSENSNLILRFDGNRLFELNELINFERRLEESILPTSFSKIDYIEEPLKNFSETFLFRNIGKNKIAMDESFETFISAEKFPLNIPVVIKPSLYGVSTIFNWMEKHSKNRIIISSSFEHPSVKIGLNFLASKNPIEYHGLENFL
jgi:O-succinylbenzoate synthase